ncbi:MAG: RNA polymerase sigma factor [Proteobacteria bacterium]|jgi:RNA polymerase sigma-70 factor (ECF subfamily)|nr:RNA polymerase sigma factor [Pseudomonadota bacterium]MCG6934950.1 RNA polymerase sigma factor [Pseudomonadota bacterium]
MALEDSDETLMLAYKKGDATAFETLYRRYKGPVYRYLLRQCRNPASAEELFQDIWLRIVNARQGYTVKASFRTWLYQIAHHRMIDHYRRQNTTLPESYLDDPGPEDVAAADTQNPARIVDGQQQAAQLSVLIDALPEAQREAFLLKEEAGMTLQEIATATDTSRETVKSRLRYAIRRLRDGMGMS